jgi:hypothetical protein
MGRPGRRNAGWFRQGYDPRRHCLTTEERRRGGRASFAYLLTHKPEVLLGLRKKLRQQQQAKQRHTQERLAEAARERQLAQEGEHYPTTEAEHDLF